MLCEGDKSNKICQHTNSKDIAEQAGIVYTPLVLSLLFKKPDTELDLNIKVEMQFLLSIGCMNTCTYTMYTHANMQ